MYCRTIIALLLFGAPAAAQEIGTAGKAPSPSPRTKYSVSVRKSTRTWKLGKASQTSDQLAQLVLDALVDQLGKKSFGRVQTLSDQCCNIVVEVSSAASSDAAGEQSQVTLSSRITLLDVDQQTVFTNEYKGEAAQAGAAASDLAKKAVGDPQLMRALAGS